MCRVMSGEYEITSPGRLSYNIPGASPPPPQPHPAPSPPPLLRWGHLCVPPTVWNLSVESYVVHTNYKEYAVVMMRPLKAPEAELATVRLFCESAF